MAQFTHVAPTIVTSGTTWAQLKTGGLKVLIDNLITANGAKTNPTVAATTGETVAAGGLAAGTYYVGYTWLDAFGETTLGTSESAAITVTDTSHRTTVTIPSLPTGCQCANIYLTQKGGAAGTETLWATGITTTTFALTDSYPSDQPTAVTGGPPTNTTGAASSETTLHMIIMGGNTERKFMTLTELISGQLSGAGMELREWFERPYRFEGLFKAWLQVMSEYNVLLAANAPTYKVFINAGAGVASNGYTLP